MWTIYPSISIFRAYAEKFRVCSRAIFCRISSRSSGVTGTRRTIFRVRFVIVSPRFLGVWGTPQQAFLPGVATLPMLAMKVLSSDTYYKGTLRFAKGAKKKRCNPVKAATLLSVIFSCVRTAYLSELSISATSFAVAVTIRNPLSLILSSRVSSCRRCVDFSASLFGKKNWSTDML